MITRIKDPIVESYDIYRDREYIGTIEKHDTRYWRVIDASNVTLKERIRTLKSAIWELERLSEDQQDIDEAQHILNDPKTEWVPWDKVKEQLHPRSPA